MRITEGRPENIQQGVAEPLLPRSRLFGVLTTNLVGSYKPVSEPSN